MAAIPEHIASSYSDLCTNSSDPAAQFSNTFLTRSQPDYISIILSGHLPDDAQLSACASHIGLGEEAVRWLTAELWRVCIEESDRSAKNSLSISDDALVLALTKKRRPIHSYFIQSDIIRFWEKGMIGEYLTSDTRLSTAAITLLTKRGCHIFSSMDQLIETIRREKWPNWEEFIQESEGEHR
jgi:hypothetical protein